MTAGYLTSEYQRAILTPISAADRQGGDFFAVAPIVIDCRGEAGAWRAAVSDAQRDSILKAYNKGTLRYVSQLLRPGYSYARQQVRERFKLLDREAVEQVQQFLGLWRLEADKRSSQRSRPDEYKASYGIELLLPEGVRLAYDLPSLTGL